MTLTEVRSKLIKKNMEEVEAPVAGVNVVRVEGFTSTISDLSLTKPMNVPEAYAAFC